MSTPDVAETTPSTTTGWLDRARRWTIPVLVANLVAQIVIIVTGGAVRLTDSGLGCSEWPSCEPGHFSPQFHSAMPIHQLIEFGNRTLTGVLCVIALLVLLLVRTDRTRALSYRRLGVAPIVLVALQAVLGGIIVLLKLPPALVGFHFLISAGLVAASALLLYRARERDGNAEYVVDRRTLLVARTLGVVLIPVLVLGVLVTGSGPHGGDDEVAYRFALDPAFITRFHSGTVWIFILLLAVLTALVLRQPGSPRRPRRAIGWLIAVTLLQGVVGYVQYFTGLPEALVALHMLCAALLITATTWLLLTLRVRR